MIPGLRRLQCLFDGSDLGAQRGDLLVEQFDLAHRPLAHLLLGIELLRQPADPQVGGIRRTSTGVEQLLQPAAFAFGDGERGLQRRKRILQILFAALFQRKQLGQFGDLAVEAVEDLVLAGDLAAEDELRQHEDREQEHDRQK